MATWGTLRRAIEAQRWHDIWSNVESLDEPIEDVVRFITRHCRTPARCREAYIEGKWVAFRCAGHYPRTAQALREWGRLNDIAEQETADEAARTRAPVLFMSSTNPWGASVDVNRDVFDRVGGLYMLDLPVATTDETPAEWTGPVRYEHRAVVTPSGLYCHLRREPDAALTTRLHVRRVATDDTTPPNAPIDDALAELHIGHDEVIWIDERALGFTPHTVIRQDDHGQEFEVETLPSRHAAAERVRAFEAAAHKQHYWTVPAPSHDPESLAYSVADWETLELMLDAGQWDTAWEVVEVMEAPIEEVARHVWDHFHAADDFYAPTSTARRLARKRKEADEPALERVARVLELWMRWNDEHEAEAIALAKSQGAPVPFRGLPGRIHGAFAGVPREVFDTTPGHYERDEPVHGVPSDGGGELIQYEYKSLVTPTGVFCMLRRATERELRLFGHWERGTFIHVDLLLERPLPFDDEDSPRVMARLLDDALTGLGVSPDDLIWSNDDPSFTPHTLMRQDDNGRDFAVDTFPSRHAAAARMRALDALTHKQHYWVVPT